MALRANPIGALVTHACLYHTLHDKLKTRVQTMDFLCTFAAPKIEGSPHEEYPEFLYYRSY
jgi:hypothetical protein